MKFFDIVLFLVIFISVFLFRVILFFSSIFLNINDILKWMNAPILDIPTPEKLNEFCRFYNYSYTFLLNGKQYCTDTIYEYPVIYEGNGSYKFVKEHD